MYNSDGTGSVQLNHLSWDGTFLERANRGIDRVLPHAIDFTTADIRSEWSGASGQMWYDSAPDHLDVHFEHKPMRAYDFHLTVTFESKGFALKNRLSDLWDVAFYTWDSEKDDITTGDGWAGVIAREPADQLKMNRIDFRCDEGPYSSARFPPSPKLRELKRRDFFALVATSEWELPAGTFEAHTLSDDGIRVFIDDRSMIDDWTRHYVNEEKEKVKLKEGKHRIRVEYFESVIHARLKFSLRRLED